MDKSDKRSLTQAKAHSVGTTGDSLVGRGLQDLRAIGGKITSNDGKAKHHKMRWRSFYADELLSDYELMYEMALHTMCREYIMQYTIGLDSPSIALCADAIALSQDEIHYKPIMPFPVELYDLFKEEFNNCLNACRYEYGLLSPIDNLTQSKTPSGEKLGGMLRYFDSLSELIMVCNTKRCWNADNILLLHGMHSSYKSPKELTNSFDEAGIYYMTIFNDDAYNKKHNGSSVSDEDIANFAGCGAFVAVNFDEAANIALSLNEGNRIYVASILTLEHDYGENSWASNHPIFNG